MILTARARRARLVRPRTLAVMAVVLGLGAFGALRPQPSTAVPVEGHTGWSVVRCKFKGDNSEPVTRQHYEQMFTNAGLGLDTPVAYFADQSQGRIDTAGTVITNWYTMDVTLATSQGYTGSGARNQRIDDCVRAATKGGYTVPTGFRPIAAINAAVDSGTAGDRLLLDPLGLDTGFV